MSTDLKFRLLTLLLGMSFGMFIGLCAGGWLATKFAGTLVDAVSFTCGLFITTLYSLLKRLEEP